MKTPADAVAAIERRLGDTWHLTVAGDASYWPYRFPLGRPDRSALTHSFGDVQRWALDWAEWAAARGLDLEWQGRRAGGAHDTLPSHLAVPDVQTAAALRPGWRDRLDRGRARISRLTAEFPDAPPARVVRAVDTWTDTDFDLLIAAARWFQQHPNCGLSARQVPIEGLHAKWLDGHRAPVLALTGLDDLGLVEPRSTAVHFTYLDPDHLSAGRRRHDSIIPGDAAVPAYLPEMLLITENKDTAICFPSVPGGISVQGGGKSGPAFISQVPWMRDAADVIYWGDLDAAGFEIVNMYRQAGVPVRTILMDLVTLSEYRRFAATTDKRGRDLPREPAKTLRLLTGSENEAYQALTDPEGDWPVRVEQERIPLSAAVIQVEQIRSTSPSIPLHCGNDAVRR